MRPLIIAVMTLTAIMAGPALAGDTFFDVFTEATMTAPPYPTAPIETRIGTGGVRLTITGSGFRSLAAGQTDEGPAGNATPLPFACTSGFDGDNWMPESLFDITYLGDAGKRNMPTFALLLGLDEEYRAPDGTLGQLVPVSEAFPAGDPRNLFEVSFADGFFDLTYEVMFNPREYTLFRCRGEAASGLRLTNVTVRPPVCSDGTCAAFRLDVQVYVDDPANCCPISRPVIRMRETAQTYESPVANDDRTWGELKALFR